MNETMFFSQELIPSAGRSFRENHKHFYTNSTTVLGNDEGPMTIIIFNTTKFIRFIVYTYVQLQKV